jgi:hypothetical protein
MRIYLDSVLEQLLHLERELALVQARLTELMLGGGRDLEPLTLIVGHVVSTVALLRERVLESAVAEPTVERRSSALHSRLCIVAMQLHELAASEPDVAAPLWTAGRFRSVRDLVEYVTAALAHIDASQLGAMPAIDAAEAAWNALGGSADLSCFLAAGASVACVRFRNACRMLAGVLGVALAPELAVKEPDSLWS